MYATIEADIENGRITGCETQALPSTAHVLITWIRSSAEEKSPSEVAPAPGRSLRGALKMFSKPGLIQKEKEVWAHTMERKHEAG